MNKYKFDKIIRSKLIDVMEAKGVIVNKTSLSDLEYYKVLLEKLKEETQEVIDSKNDYELAEEIADVLTVIDAICNLKNINYQQIEKIKESKRNYKGDFSQKIKINYIEYDRSNPKFKLYDEYYQLNPTKYPEIK